MTSQTSTTAIELPGGNAIIYFALDLALLSTTVSWLRALNEYEPTKRRRLLGQAFVFGIAYSVVALVLIAISGAEHMLSSLLCQLMLGGSVATALFAGAAWLIALITSRPRREQEPGRSGANHTRCRRPT